MPDWKREIKKQLAGLRLSPTREAEIIEELTLHFEALYEELLADGATKAEASAALLVELTESPLLREELRWLERYAPPEPISFSAGRGDMLGDLWRNLQYSVRMLGKNFGFTTIAVLTLALGIGATAAIFSVVYATLYEPMPYPNPDQLVMVWSKYDNGRGSVSVGDYLEWKRRSTSFQYLGAWNGGTFNLATAERPEQVEGSMMTPNFFSVTGTSMSLGRDFLPEEGEVGRNKVVILSSRVWKKYFGGDHDIIGKPIRMNGEAYTVVGVAPPGMHDRLPHQVWVPLAFKPEQINHDAHWILVMGRLKDGVTLEQAQAEMAGIAKQLAEEHPESNANLSASVELLHNDFFPESSRRSLWLLLTVVGCLLLIACVNIANLFLARGTTRQKEVAIRAAMGATRGQLFRQFLTESFVLAAIGGICGVLLGGLLIKMILAIIPPMLPSEADVRISIPVLLFTLTTTMLAGLLFGCAPAWQASRLDLNEVLKQGGRTSQGAGRRGVRRVLVVVEFALALRSFWNLTRVDLGVRTDHVLTFILPVPDKRFSEPAQVAPYYRQLLEKIESVPGIEKAAVTTGIPLRGPGFGMSFTVVGQPEVAPSERPGAGFQMVTSGYFETCGIRLVKGRSFTDQDTDKSVRVALINENLANRYFADVDPLGQRIAVAELVPGSMKIGAPVEWQIVGVFHNVRNGQALREDFPEIYVPFWQSPWPQASVAVRTAGDPESVTRSIAAAVSSFDPDLPIAGVKTMEQIVDETLAVDRFGMVLFGSFAVLGLVLAGVGIYGVMAFAVEQRTHEFGVRMALGAANSQVLGLVLREGLLLAFIGIGLGLGGAYLVGKAMQSTLYEVSAMDAGAFSGVAAVLLLAALLACYVPARRASRVDPMVALRCE